MGQIRRYLPALFTVVIVGWMLAIAVPMLSDRHAYSSGKEFAKAVDDAVPEDAVLIVPPDDATFVAYYAPRKVISCPVTSTAQEAGVFEGSVRAELEAGNRVFFTDLCDMYWEYYRQPWLSGSIHNGFNLTHRTSFMYENHHGATIYHMMVNRSLYEVLQVQAS
jgi:hypothetical protein